MDLMSKREILPLDGVARDVKPLEQLTTLVTIKTKKTVEEAYKEREVAMERIAERLGRCVEYAFLVTHFDCSARDLTAACSTPFEPAGACSSPLEPTGPCSRGMERSAVRRRA